MAFLCAWPGASYVGLDFGNASRPERLWLDRSVVASRAQVQSGDAWRSVLAAPQLAACDVIVVGLREHASSSTEIQQRARISSTELQQRLLLDLPNAMRTGTPASASTAGALLLVHGAQCAVGAAVQPRLVAATSRAKKPKAKLKTVGTPVEQHWCMHCSWCGVGSSHLGGHCEESRGLLAWLASLKA